MSVTENGKVKKFRFILSSFRLKTDYYNDDDDHDDVNDEDAVKEQKASTNIDWIKLELKVNFK